MGEARVSVRGAQGATRLAAAGRLRGTERNEPRAGITKSRFEVLKRDKEKMYGSSLGEHQDLVFLAPRLSCDLQRGRTPEPGKPKVGLTYLKVTNRKDRDPTCVSARPLSSCLRRSLVTHTKD